MLVNVLVSLARIVLPFMVDKIFDAQKGYTVSGSGPVKRDVVFQAISRLIEFHAFPDFDGPKLGRLIDAQVKVLKDNNIMWSVGAGIVKTILSNIVEIEENDPEHDNKLWYVVDKTLKDLKEDVTEALDEDTLAGFVESQVKVFDEFGIFNKRVSKN